MIHHRRSTVMIVICSLLYSRRAAMHRFLGIGIYILSAIWHVAAVFSQCLVSPVPCFGFEFTDTLFIYFIYIHIHIHTHYIYICIYIYTSILSLSWLLWFGTAHGFMNASVGKASPSAVASDPLRWMFHRFVVFILVHVFGDVLFSFTCVHLCSELFDGFFPDASMFFGMLSQCSRMFPHVALAARGRRCHNMLV